MAALPPTVRVPEDPKPLPAIVTHELTGPDVGVIEVMETEAAWLCSQKERDKNKPARRINT